MIPRNLHFTRLPDDMAQIETNLFVPQENTPWPSNDHHGPRRAAVSSYGFSGTNVHAIVEQAPEMVAPGDAPTAPAIDGPLLFPLSATSADGLRRTAGRLAGWVDEHVLDLIGSTGSILTGGATPTWTSVLAFSYCVSCRAIHRSISRIVEHLDDRSRS